MFTLSLCMIVRNEEQTLDRILSCAKKFCDEIIIVDTGSTDNTIDICRKYTSNIYNFEWQDDFSLARNFSFSKATKDYIIWLDADDNITKENIEKLINLKSKENTETDFYMLKYVMGFVNNAPTFEFYRERIIKNNHNYKWQGFIHEAITPQGNIKYLDIQIEHRKEKTNPPMRNLKIYRKALKRGLKFSAREQYYYARELYFNNYFKKTIIELKKYLHMPNKYEPNIIDAYLIIAKSHIKLKDFSSALNVIFDCIKTHIPTPEICCLLAQIYEEFQNINYAILWYNIAMLTPSPKSGFIQKDYEDFIPLIELCRIYYKFNYTKSKEYFNKAKTLKPDDELIIANNNFFEK